LHERTWSFSIGSVVIFRDFAAFPMSKQKVLQTYKELLYIAKYYPNKDYSVLKRQITNAFRKNMNLTDPEEILQKVKHGQYIYKEIEALVSLKKYRTLKNNYDQGEFE
jgi:hypothetical protein